MEAIGIVTRHSSGSEPQVSKLAARTVLELSESLPAPPSWGTCWQPALQALCNAWHCMQVQQILPGFLKLSSDRMLDQVALFSTNFFCASALYITLVEQPARMQVPVREAARQFGKSYPRAAILQPIYIAITCAASILRLLANLTTPRNLPQRLQQAHLLNALLMAGCGIGTVVFMLPGNKALLSAERESDVRVKQLLQTWGRQHGLRTVASLAAAIVLLSACTSADA